MARLDPDPKYGTMSTVLHEAAHNLGPSHEYRVGGATDDKIFGGAAAMSGNSAANAGTASCFPQTAKCLQARAFSAAGAADLRTSISLAWS